MNLRHLLPTLAASLGLWAAALPALAGDGIVHRTSSCGCCHLWNERMKEHGLTFADDIVTYDELDRIKADFGLPGNAAACHTAQIGGYLIEGHVPAFAIKRLLAEKPAGVRGLVVPGMPTSSPGMGGPLVVYDIFLLTEDGDLEPWAKARGSEEVTSE